MIKFLTAFIFLTFANLSIGQSSDKINSKLDKIIKVPIIVEGDTLFFIQGNAKNTPVDFRADNINKRLASSQRKFNKLVDSVHLIKQGNVLQILHNNQFLLFVTPSDASLEGIELEELAKNRASLIQAKLNEHITMSPTDWFKKIGLFLLLFIALYFVVRLVNLVFNRVTKRLSKIERKFLNRKGNVLKYFLPRNNNNIFVLLVNMVRIVTILVLIVFGAPFLFSFFPFSKNIVRQFYGYIKEPVIYIVNGVIDFIPSLFFIIIIVLTSRYVVRVIKAISLDVEKGKLEITGFHKEWAAPTSKLFTIFIYALTLVLIFPYLPGSGSSAFQGVSIFIGAIISFGSTSAIANIIAGIVITYMRPFQIGDRVKIDNIVGDVIAKTILVTQLKTSKNEDVTIPNANILVGNIINYSGKESDNIILHTTVTLGYDVPWTQANKLLIEAAKKSPHIMKTPEPFVLQTSLDDFYVSYELNAYTQEFKKIPFIYSEIHKNILDIFDEAEVEILSPGYAAMRDGSMSTLPSQSDKPVKTPFNRLINHLTGRDQPNIIEQKNDSE